MGCNLRDLATAHPLEMSELAGQRVAVDVFLNAYQFITSLTAQDGKPLSYNGKPVAHLMGFLDRATVMIESGIDPVFVFDDIVFKRVKCTYRARCILKNSE